MQGFEWGENNLGVQTPHDLQGQGVNDFFAPNLAPDTWVVDLGTGALRRFQAQQYYLTTGYCADDDTLIRHCRKQGIALSETDGQLSTAPGGKGEAGDPFRRGGGRPPATLEEAQRAAQQQGHLLVESNASASDRVHTLACQHAGCAANDASGVFARVLPGSTRRHERNWREAGRTGLFVQGIKVNAEAGIFDDGVQEQGRAPLQQRKRNDDVAQDLPVLMPIC